MPSRVIDRILQPIERRIDVFSPFDDRRTPPARVLGFVWHYLKPTRGWLCVILATWLLIALAESSLLLIVGWLVDRLTAAAPASFVSENLGLLAGGAVLLLLGLPALQALGEIAVNQAFSPQITNQIRWRTHLYTLGHSLSYFQGDFAGRLANRIVQVGPAVRDIALGIVDNLWYVFVYAATAVTIFASTDPLLALPVVVWLALYVWMLAYFVPRAQTLSAAVAGRRSTLVGRIVDTYTNILTVKLFARHEVERSAVRGAVAAHTEAHLRQMRLMSAVGILLSFLNAALFVASMAVSVHLWSRGEMTAGAIAAALGLVLRITAMSGWVMHVVRDVFENIGTVQESMDTIVHPHGVVDAPGARALAVAKGEIRFERVGFHYGRQSGVIDGLDLVVRPGEKIGLVGPSGAGKSTLVNLLLRLYDLESGRILVDGQDIAGATQDSLRAQIAVVTQDTSLLHRSIRDNIRYGRPEAGEDEIVRAAERAAAHGFILGLEDHKGRTGYDSQVGERGVKLSGGQRQRIAIARVLLKDAPILILDEATSALDSEAEAAIQEQLTHLMAGKTVIAIAHRLSTIAALDRLVVMDKGRIVEEGTHAELVARGGLYARLWQRQSGGFLGEAE